MRLPAIGPLFCAHAADVLQGRHGVLNFVRNLRRLDAGQDWPWYQAIDVRRLLAEAEATPRESQATVAQ